MRLKALALALAISFLPAAVVPAIANGTTPVKKVHKVKKVYKPHKVHKVRRCCGYKVHVVRQDPYAWYYSPRGYYGYYGSAYWAPTAVVRAKHHARYRYAPAWGYPRVGYGYGCCGRYHRPHRWHW